MTTLARPGISPIAEQLYAAVEFAPTPEQDVILGCRKRFIVVSGGEQAGKSIVASKFLLGRFTETEGKGLYWLVAADYERTKAEFDYLANDFAVLGLLKNASKRVDPGYIELVDGTRIETKSAKDSRTLAMRAPDGIIICEASQVDLETFNKCRLRVGPRRGWLFLAGTLEGSLGWYPSLITEWQYGVEDRQSFGLPSWTNIHMYPGGRNDPEIIAMERDSSDDFFMERIEGKPTPPKGIVFPQFSPDLHVDADLEYVKGEPIHLWNDPGYAHANATLAVQIIDGQVRVFDEIYERSLITEDIIDIVMAKPWIKDVKFGVIDVGGTQHQAMSSPAEVWQAKLGLSMSYQRVLINEGIERVKAFLKRDPVTGRPRLLVHPKCVGLVSELGIVPNPFDGHTRAYRWKMDRDGIIVGDVPEDKNNDAIKALTYGLWDRYGPVDLGSRRVIKIRRH